MIRVTKRERKKLNEIYCLENKNIKFKTASLRDSFWIHGAEMLRLHHPWHYDVERRNCTPRWVRSYGVEVCSYDARYVTIDDLADKTSSPSLHEHLHIRQWKILFLLNTSCSFWVSSTGKRRDFFGGSRLYIV